MRPRASQAEHEPCYLATACPIDIETGRTGGYTSGMKTAVSLPDEVFRAAERQARRLKKSRSQLYAQALSEYLARHAPDEVTAAMNRVVETLREPTDPFVSAAARRVASRASWKFELGTRKKAKAR